MAGTRFGPIAWGLVAVAAAGAGYLAGNQRGHAATIAALQTEAAGNLSQRVEALSLLRLEDVPAAISRLEAEADKLGRSIAQNPYADQRVLAVLKTYLTVAPPSAARAATLSPALEGVPILEPSQCDTGLKRLLLAKQGEPIGQPR